jgi:hypothetical protein
MKRLLILVPLLTACSGDLPVYSLVESLRVLAVKVDPPKFLFDQTSTSVTFDALVVDPKGGPVDVRWQFCPVESSKACRDYDTLFAQASAVATAVAQKVAPGTTLDFGPVQAAHELALSGTAQPAAADAALPASEVLRPYGIPSFVLGHDDVQGLDTFFEYSSLFGYGEGAWPSAILTVTSAGNSVTTEKRVVASLADLSAINGVLFGALGLQFCPKTVADDPRPCKEWDPSRAGNHNPVFAASRWSAGKSPLATWEDLPADGSPLPVKAGAEIRLLPTFTPESFESYQIIRTTLATNDIQLEEATEELSVSWFVTAGKIQDALTWPLFTRSLDTVYTAPKTPPSDTGGLVTVWMVGQDQRGGTSWTHVDLLISE